MPKPSIGAERGRGARLDQRIAVSGSSANRLSTPDGPNGFEPRIVTRRSAESDEMMRLAVKPMWRWLLIGVVMPINRPWYVKLEHGEDLPDTIAV